MSAESLSRVFPFILTTRASVRRQPSLCHACFPSSLQHELRLDVSLVSLCHTCFPSSLQHELRLDVSLVSLSLCHACFPSSLQHELRLDISLVSVCYNMRLKRTTAAPLPGEHLNGSLGVMQEKSELNTMESWIELMEEIGTTPFPENVGPIGPLTRTVGKRSRP